MRLRIASTLMSAACFGSMLHASILLDRPLPISNLNNAAGSSRSNVAWAEGASDGTFNWTYGDDFNIGSAGHTYKITDLTVWVIGNANNDSLNDIFSSLTLAGGAPGTTASASSACATTTGSVQSAPCWTADDIHSIATGNTNGSDPDLAVNTVTYANSDSYQSTAGSFRNIYQVTFQNLNWVVQGGTPYAFFVFGAAGAVGNGGNSPFLSASNQALSGNTQEGADGKIWELVQDATTSFFVAMDQWDSQGLGWDKSSDINVEIAGVETPEPGTLGLLAGGLGLVAMKLRRRSGR